jgi:hypothetical protein
MHDTYKYEPDHEASNINTDVFKLMINAHDQRPEQSRTLLDFSVWNTMSTEDREKWSSFSDEVKGNILNASSSDKPAARKSGGCPPGKFPPRCNPNNNRTRNANLHGISAYDYLQETTLQEGHDIDDAHGHDKDEDVFVDSSLSDVPEDTMNPLLAYVTKDRPLPAKRQSIRRRATRNVLSTTKKRYEASASEITLNGKTYREVNMAQQQVYRIANYKACKKGETLVDCGANGGLAGSDVRVINKTGRSVDVIGIDNHTVNDLPIVTAGGVINSHCGPVIAILHQYAYVGDGKTIHSSAQLEWFKNDVNDRSLKITGGLQRIMTVEGYVHPLNIRNGLAHAIMRPYTDEEWETLPHVIWTSDEEWDPTVLVHEITDDDTWYDAISDLQGSLMNSPFDKYGRYRKREAEMHFFDSQMDHEDMIEEAVNRVTLAHATLQRPH